MPLYIHDIVTVSAPEGWQDQSAIILAAPYDAENGFQPRVMAVRTTAAEPPQAAAIGALHVEKLSEMLPGAELLEQGSLNLNGFEAFQMVYAWELAGAPKATRVQVFASRGNDLYTLIGDCPSAVWDRYGSLYMDIIRSFQLRPEDTGQRY